VENEVHKLTTIDESLNRAFVLAHFIVGNKRNAVRVVVQAMAKLEVRAAAQFKRLYYKGAGRSDGSATFRSKVTFSELHLLQRLIYIESEPYEKQKEHATGIEAAAKEDLIVHFIKHLVWITSKRNSFYVTLGISRLLYSYTTPDTMSIYNLVVQDPDRVKDNYYYRSRKGVLLRELKVRFGELIRISEGQWGEERIAADPNPDKFVALVRECLTNFTPWLTVCSVPLNVDPVTVEIPALSSRVDISEDEIELNRMHAVLHPDCYARLTKALGLENPEGQLEIPQFYFSDESKNGGETVRTLSGGLDKEDLTAIKNELTDFAERRKKASAGCLRILVDGTEHMSLDLMNASQVCFNVESGKELLEIWTTDQKGDLLLTSYLLATERYGEPKAIKSSIVLEGGQKLTIDTLLSADASSFMVEIDYRETNPFKATSLALQRALAASRLDRFVATRAFGVNGHGKYALPASALIVLIMITAGVVIYTQRGRDFGSQPTGKASQTESSAVQQHVASPGQSSVPQQESTLAQQNDHSDDKLNPNASPSPGTLIARADPGHNADTTRGTLSVDSASETGEEATRSLTREEPRLSLVDVKSVYVDFVGNETSQRVLREVLLEKLQASNRFTLSKARDNADAVLTVTMKRPAAVASNAPHSAARVFAVQLISAQGQVLWPLKGRRLERTYSAASEQQVGVQIIQDLLVDISKDKRLR
jgi:hypothetical protein